MRSRFIRSAATIGAVSALVVGGFASAAYPHGSNDGGRSYRHHHGGDTSSAPVVVTNGLNNPRQLSLVDGKVLLIAEAGAGGTVCGADSPEGPQCLGASGSVSGVLFPQYGTNRTHTELVTGLMSSASPDGSFAVGSDGVSQRDLHSPIYIQETYAPPDVLPSGIPGEQAGKLLKARPFGPVSPVADISAFETANDPDGHGFDSDPYAVLVRHHDALVADAAGNDVLRVDHHGNVSLFHKFDNVVNDITTAAHDPESPFPGADFVPTSLAVDRHGDVYVGGLVALIPGAGQVVKLDGRTGAVKQVWEGFTAVTGVAVGSDCSLYVSQLFADQANPAVPDIQGVLTKVTPDGVHHDLDVPFPAGIALDRHDNVFVSAWSISPAGGQSELPPGFTADTSGQVWRLHF